MLEDKKQTSGVCVSRISRLYHTHSGGDAVLLLAVGVLPSPHPPTPGESPTVKPQKQGSRTVEASEDDSAPVYTGGKSSPLEAMRVAPYLRCVRCSRLPKCQHAVHVLSWGKMYL